MTRKECKILLIRLQTQFQGIAADAREEHEKLVNIKAISQRSLRLLLSLEARGLRLAKELGKEVQGLEKP